MSDSERGDFSIKRSLIFYRGLKIDDGAEARFQPQGNYPESAILKELEKVSPEKRCDRLFELVKERLGLDPVILVPDYVEVSLWNYEFTRQDTLDELRFFIEEIFSRGESGIVQVGREHIEVVGIELEDEGAEIVLLLPDRSRMRVATDEVRDIVKKA